MRIDEGGLAARGVTIELAPVWRDEELDALLMHESPWAQPVLDRDGRQLVLAGWPEGTRRLDADADYERLVPLEVLDDMPDEVASLIRARMSARSWVLTPADEWMLALDDLLAATVG
jgi:hypothetical protein